MGGDVCCEVGDRWELVRLLESAGNSFCLIGSSIREVNWALIMFMQFSNRGW